MESQTPLTIGVHGYWGVGKTSFLNLLEGDLKKNPDNNIKIIGFESWAYSYEKDIWKAFLIRILTELDPDYSKPGRAVKTNTSKLLRYVLEGGTHLSLGVATGGLSLPLMLKSLLPSCIKNPEEAADLITIKDVESKVELMKSVQDFRSTFEELVKEKLGENGRVVVFVDDLDRCMPNEALELLTALKVFLNVKGCVYVIACDENTVSKIVKKIYDVDGYDYLEKIIDLPFYIPLIADELADSFLEAIMEKQKDNANSTELKQMLVKSADKNPRKIKRLVNIIKLSELIVDSKGLVPNFELLAKLHAMSYSYREVYELVSSDPFLFIILESYSQNSYRMDKEMAHMTFDPGSPEEKIADKTSISLNILENGLEGDYISVEENTLSVNGLRFQINFKEDNLKLIFSNVPCFEKVGEDDLKRYIQLVDTIKETEKTEKDKDHTFDSESEETPSDVINREKKAPKKRKRGKGNYYINGLEYLGRPVKIKGKEMKGVEAKKFVTLKKLDTIPSLDEVIEIAKSNQKVKKVWVMYKEGNKWKKVMDTISV